MKAPGSVSVVIPAWNEAAWLPRLLGQLNRWNAVGEVIVADNASSDSTRSTAKARGCSVVHGGRPAAGRNRGAAAAKEGVLLFIDADAVLTTSIAQFVAKTAADFAGKAIHFRNVPIAPRAPVKTAYRVMDHYLAALHRFGIAQGVGTFVLVDRDLYWRAGGSDEALAYGEDADLIRRLGHAGNVHYCRESWIYVSARRFRTENPYWFAAKTALWAGMRLVDYRSGPPYRWLPHDEDLVEIEKAWLSQASGVLPGWDEQ